MKSERLIVPAVAAACIVVVGVPLRSVPPPVSPDFGDPPSEAFLEWGDESYDAAERLLREPFRSAGYHSRIPSGRPVHSIRESLAYAVALLARDEPGDADRAVAILDRVAGLQEQRPGEPLRGVWPWVLEESLAEMSPPDPNWADFCGAHIAHVLHVHGERLPESLRGRLETALRLAAASIRARDVGPAYTNIAVLGGSVCAAAGERLDDDELLAYGRERLEAVVAHADRSGGFSEYNSPPYAQVVVTACERTLLVVRDARTRAAAEAIRCRAWTMIGDHLHPPTSQWAGPHARTSRDRLRPSTLRFLNRRIGLSLVPHETMLHEVPREHEVVPPVPAPDAVRRHLHAGIRSTETRHDTFIRRRSHARSIVGTTWRSPLACLGSVSRASFWTQRKPVIGYWRTDDEPSVVLRVRFLKDGRDFASMRVRTVQRGPRVLATVHPIAGRGDWHRTLDRPPDGRFPAEDLRLRIEIRGRGVALEPSNGNGRTRTLSAGRHRVVVHAAPGTFAGHPVRWTTGRSEDHVFVDAVCHAGSSTVFDFDEPIPILLAFGLELLDDRTPPSADRVRAATNEATTWGTLVISAEPGSG